MTLSGGIPARRPHLGHDAASTPRVCALPPGPKDQRSCDTKSSREQQELESGHAQCISFVAAREERERKDQAALRHLQAR
jgi:hypothetical protein